MADVVVNDDGLISSLLVRNSVETMDRRKLKQPEINISLEVETFNLLHLAPTTFATDTEAAV